MPAAERDGDLAAAYQRLLSDPDPALRAKAARDWCDWETASVPTTPANSRFDPPEFRMAFARVVTHYFSNGSWLADGALLANAGSLAAIPGVLVQGALDLGNLLGTPWLLANAWPGSELVLIDEAGHDTGHGMADAITAATSRFAALA